MTLLLLVLHHRDMGFSVEKHTTFSRNYQLVCQYICMENLCALNNIIDKNFLYLAYNAVFPLTENSSLPFYSFKLHVLGDYSSTAVIRIGLLGTV